MKNLSNVVERVLSPNKHIESKTRDEIEAYIAGRGKTRVHQGARNLSLNVSDDYGNRFLVELIQNAHDAHPVDRDDGEIAIVLAPQEGDHGCLYIANRGNGFDSDNFDSITNIALSSKPVNESIGNKGLGFRSVLQICRWPEIYSVAPGDGPETFDGYCFRFATEADLDLILSEMGQASLSAEIWENMPCWFLPVVAKARPGLVERFAKEGFVSVVRMPLESEDARAMVSERIDWLLALETPLHLFLNRIASIRIEPEPGRVEILERKCLATWPQLSGVEIQRLQIGKDEFLLTAMDLDQPEFRHALDDSLAKKQVPDSWKDWKGAARLSVAIRLNRSVEKGLLYCFLPLGAEGRAPFSGYINANFYTKMDRRSVDGTISLNRFFISSAARLCKHAIDFLIEQNWPESPAGVVDLLCWSGTYAGDVRLAFDSDEQHIVKELVLPTWASSAVQWTAAEDTFIWDVPPNSCLSVEAIAEAAGAAILLPSLSLKQREAVKNFFLMVNERFGPSAETIADWVESIARSMQETGARPETWAALYDEVAMHLRSEPSVLFGKRFLLSATGGLIASQPTGESGGRRRAADIYFPPGGARDSQDDLDNAEPGSLPLEKLPASLRRGFAFLSREVPWLNKEGGYRPARAFFLEAKLVREYDTREVLRTLAAITRSTVADSTKETALEWAFRLWSSGRSLSIKETRGARFALPTKSGWRSSEQAMFGAGWSTPNGKPLEKLLKVGSEISADLANARECVLLARKEWPVGFGGEEEWFSFLQAAGARDCLRPVGGEKRIQKDVLGNSMDGAIRDAVELDEETSLLWNRQLTVRANRIRNPYTAYRCELNPWTFPGQGGSLSFPDTSLRRDYAYQVLKAIPHLDKEHLSFQVYRPGRYGSDRNEERWSTPLKAFVSEAPWMPVQRAGGEIRFVPPSEAWLSSLDFDPRPPRFVDLVSPSVVRNSDDGLEWLRSNVELGVLDDPKHAERAIRVYANAAGDKLTEDGDVRRFRELFSLAWNAIIEGRKQPDLDWVPVRVGDRIEALSLGELEEEQKTPATAYFADEDNDAKKQLLAELEEPIFDFSVLDAQATWELLTKLAPGRFRRISEQPLEVHVDGCRFELGSETALLRDVFGGWIADFLVCAAEHKGGSFFTRTQKTLSKLKHTAEVLRFKLARRLEISLDGSTKGLPSSVRGAVVLRDGPITTLVVAATDGKANLDLLARVAEQLAVALNQKGLANGFEAALLRLANLHGDEASKPVDEDIAEALGVEVSELEQTRRYAQSDLSSHVSFAQPLAAYLGLDESVDFLRRLSEEDDLSEDRVLEALKPISDALGIGDQELVARLGLVSEIRGFKSTFVLELPRLNAALRSLGGRFHPINNRDFHVMQFRAYLSNNNARIVGRVRTGFVDDFDNLQDLSRYVQLRGAVETIEVDSEWFETYDELPEEVMEQRIEIWLLGHDVPAAAISCDLPTLSECRDKNGRALREFSKRYAAVVSAWVRQSQNGVTDALLELWLDPEASKLGLIQRAQANGWSEFRLLDDMKIAKWLERSGFWPQGKPVSASPTDWGLLEDAVTQGQRDADRDREVRRKERSEIAFAGQRVSALEDDYQGLMDAVTVRLSEAVGLLDIDSSFRSLLDVQEPTGGGGGTGGGSSRSRKSVDSSMSDEQKRAVGFIGERWAFEWIKAFHQKRHNKQLDDNCWVSGNRNIVLGGTTGRDDLGYDFVVRLSSTTYYYEVKASTGNPRFFEMGPTEIGAALRYKADGDNKYRILYVAYATDPQRVEATILLNPFSREGEKKLRAIGRGSVKYEFGVADHD